ncbi:SDR family oxidoreductase [Actinoplanes sp. NPDC023936]|uniref:SDR family oxidoreductase n=1 Tax=Actinoplanes sp. NPDC023936 TaxID=3154910 RepID=UPI0033C22E77
MTTIAVTGATGQLGRLVVDALIARGATPGDIVATVRDTTKTADLAARGVQVREADYDRPETLAAAFAGVDRLLLISGNEVGKRLPQHTAVIDAAKAAGVGFVAYTSLLRADSSPLGLAPEHRGTEEKLAATGLPHALLRNGWYTENYAGSIAGALATGAIAGSAGDGRIAAATRADYAEAAAAVLLAGEPGVYELGGEPFTMSELAAEVSKQSGKPVSYQNLPVAEYQKVLVGAGLPDHYAQMLAETDGLIVDGHLDTDRDDLAKLIGRPVTPLSDAVAAALKN